MPLSQRYAASSALALTLAALLTACGGGSGTQQTTAGGDAATAKTSGANLTGAGATFPYPIYSKWFSDYATKTGVKINYQSIGSGGGIRQLTEGTVDFGASDAPMTDAELAKAKGPILHIPTVLGAVVVTYNLPGVTQPLKLTGDVIADIFLGKITKWSDSRIKALNNGVALPNSDILVVHRSDGSGTTYIFSDYLAAVSPAWATAPGKGKELQWPVGVGGKGNEGVAGQVKQTPGAIGYVELAYAKQNGLPYASVKNASGQFVAPSIESVTAAAAGAAGKLPANTDFRLSIVNAPGAATYPISSFTYLLIDKTPANAVKQQQLLDFLKWALSDGEQSAAALDYAPAASVDRFPAQRSFGLAVRRTENVTEAAVASEGSPSPLARLGGTPPDGGKAEDFRAGIQGAVIGDRVYAGAITIFALCVPGLLLLIALEIFVAGWPALRQFGFSFLTSSAWDPVNGRFGAAPAIYGTLVSSAIALAHRRRRSPSAWRSSCPSSPRQWMRQPVAFLVDLLAAIPSVVYGLWGIFVLLPVLRVTVMPFLRDTLHLGVLPLFSGPAYGPSMLAAGLILAIMVLPYISSVSREVLLAVPRSQREAALALGATKWETIWGAVLPYAKSGIIGGIILGLGRALGETMAVTMLIGNRPRSRRRSSRPATPWRR